MTKTMRRPFPRSSVIQTVLLSKHRFMEPKEAKAWLKKHGFRRALDEKPNTYRARQADPSSFLKGSFRTIEFADGIKAVIGCPTKKSGLS